jgi:hypothetical protein
MGGWRAQGLLALEGMGSMVRLHTVGLQVLLELLVLV